MLKEILNLNGVEKLNNKTLKKIEGGNVKGAGSSNPNITWKCYRNNSGNRFFFSSVDLNSATTVCYAISNAENTIGALGVVGFSHP